MSSVTPPILDKLMMIKTAEMTGCPILSFFTGAGFLDIGFLSNNFNVVWHNEYHKAFVKGFEYGMSAMGYSGHSAKVQNTESIINIGPNEILNQAFKGAQPPKLFGVIGGPPCPDFSVGGKNRGREGDHGKLSEVYLNRVLELNPAFFVFENVPGLLRTSKHRAFLIQILRKLNNRFALDIKILNALEFGVPQDRERVFIVGFNYSWLKKNCKGHQIKKITASSNDLLRLEELSAREFFKVHQHWFPWPSNPDLKDAKKKFIWPNKKGDAEFSVQGKNPKELMVGTYICDTDLSKLPNSQEHFRPKSSKFHEIIEGDVSRKSFKRLHRSRYSPAAAYGNNEVHLHPFLPRRLTVREAMMIQSVPEKYALPPEMTLSDKFKTIGNGVPVKMANALASSISDFIERGCDG
ncbi:DNA cytosine methyltransferase [Maridesulfovibrio sp.]|uniref:DNA cytosine methyltransferase n=1 Tax=Maridesulfovibrio sp. TaxID=2795000 RepID=UPI003B00BBB9